jgi:signal transduction histidine kinase
VDELAAAHPARTIEVAAGGRQRGEWDCARITQAFANLIENALQHGSPSATVRIEVLGGEDDDVTVAIHNHGPAISTEHLSGLFNPMKARERPDDLSAAGPLGNLGLGLYIAERIVAAHNGRIAVESTEARGTTFTVTLPRRE